MQKVAVYCRVSTDKDDQANSFESQQRYFRDYVDRHPEWELANIYADEGLSGTSTKKRVAFNRMINDANLGQFDIIITKEVSRFSRNILDTISYTRELRSKGIGVIFANDGINTLEPDSELRLSIMGSIAQEESRKTSSRVKWGQTRRMEQGVVFGRSMLGYDVKNGKMTVNPGGAEIVKLIFHKYVEERKGTSVIARELREAGYKTYRGNYNWTNSVILKILRNEKYCGDLCQKKTYTPDYLSHQKKYNHNEEKKVFLKDHHEAIIDRKLWDEAQKEIVRRDVVTNVKQGHGNRYVLSGKIKCGECGATFVSRQKTSSGGNTYRYWRCATATGYGSKKVDKTGKEIGCNIGKQIRNEVAMNILKQCVDSLILNRVDIIENITNIVSSVIKSYKQEQQVALAKLEHQLKAIIQKKKNVLDTFFSSWITKEEMRMMIEQYDIDIAELTNKLEITKQKQEPEVIYTDIKTEISKKIEDIVYGKTNSESFYGNLLNTMTVFSNNKIKVELNFLPTKWIYILER